MAKKTPNNKIIDEINYLKEELRLLKSMMPSVDLTKVCNGSELVTASFKEHYLDVDQKQIVIPYETPSLVDIRITVFIVDCRGNEQVLFDYLESGKNAVSFCQDKFPPGIYFCSLALNGKIVDVYKLTLP